MDENDPGRAQEELRRYLRGPKTSEIAATLFVSFILAIFMTGLAYAIGRHYQLNRLILFLSAKATFWTSIYFFGWFFIRGSYSESVPTWVPPVRPWVPLPPNPQPEPTSPPIADDSPFDWPPRWGRTSPPTQSATLPEKKPLD
jgi:hypothetical protein